MTHYSEEFRSSLLARMLPPNNIKVADIANETGVPRDTLYGWLGKYRNNKKALVANVGKTVAKYNSSDKLATIIATASFNETELNEYCRGKGLYPIQIENWRTAFIQRGTEDEGSHRHDPELLKKFNLVNKDLARKEKALAEVTALLVLQKKFQALMEGLEGQ